MLSGWENDVSAFWLICNVAKIDNFSRGNKRKVNCSFGLCTVCLLPAVLYTHVKNHSLIRSLIDRSVVFISS